MTVQLSVLAKAETIQLFVMPSGSSSQTNLRSQDGKWQLSLPSDAFPGLLPGRMICAIIGVTSVALEEKVDALVGLDGGPLDSVKKLVKPN